MYDIVIGAALMIAASSSPQYPHQSPPIPKETAVLVEEESRPASRAERRKINRKKRM